jgi:hypothetical protein
MPTMLPQGEQRPVERQVGLPNVPALTCGRNDTGGHAMPTRRNERRARSEPAARGIRTRLRRFSGLLGSRHSLERWSVGAQDGVEHGVGGCAVYNGAFPENCVAVSADALRNALASYVGYRGNDFQPV